MIISLQTWCHPESKLGIGLIWIGAGVEGSFLDVSCVLKNGIPSCNHPILTGSDIAWSSPSISDPVDFIPQYNIAKQPCLSCI